MYWKWLPWKYIVRRLARSYGFLDPIALLSHVRRFSQPGEVAEPIELLRAGVVLHARGLINSRVIQQNLDWVWPYWVRRQFNPADPSFIPRAFSLTHINLSQRNWTAVGLPDVDSLPIIDPQGLVTPHWDGWSLDVWLADRGGRLLWPGRQAVAAQTLEYNGTLAVVTHVNGKGMSLHLRTSVQISNGTPVCVLETAGMGEMPGFLVVSLRPCNPEGIHFIHDIVFQQTQKQWWVDERPAAVLDTPPDRHLTSNYREGDVALHLSSETSREHTSCTVGLCSAAALYALDPGQSRQVRVEVPLAQKKKDTPGFQGRPVPSWTASLQGGTRLHLPDSHLQYLYEAALRAVILHAPGEVYPGPYTYKRFWFRDAVFIAHALMACGLKARAQRILDHFPERQTVTGFFHSQQGEWDSNGAVLWVYGRFCELFRHTPDSKWCHAMLRGAHWLMHKRLPLAPSSPHAGLLPAGFSAEHLGPTDYYYWDDFWAVAGLRAAERWCGRASQNPGGVLPPHSADDVMAAIDQSLAQVRRRLQRPAMPASPYRRLDSGAVGSLVVGYPCQLVDPRDERLLDTADYLFTHCRVRGAFYHDLIHSGINAYLTLHLAQVLMRARDRRFISLVEAIARLASPTGQWPEAIHPRSLGGCMGDGQHIWAAAEYLMWIRNSFIREETDHLVVGEGILPAWLVPGEVLSFGPAPTPWGPVEVFIKCRPGAVTVRCQGHWFESTPRVQVALPGWECVDVPDHAESVSLTKRTRS